MEEKEQKKNPWASVSLKKTGLTEKRTDQEKTDLEDLILKQHTLSIIEEENKIKRESNTSVRIVEHYPFAPPHPY